MKKGKRTTSTVRKRKQNLPPPARPKSSGPRYHPSTGQVLSETEGDSPYLPAKRRKKARAAVTIAPSTRSGRDVFVHRPGRKGGG